MLAGWPRVDNNPIDNFWSWNFDKAAKSCLARIEPELLWPDAVPDLEGRGGDAHPQRPAVVVAFVEMRLRPCLGKDRRLVTVLFDHILGRFPYLVFGFHPLAGVVETAGQLCREWQLQARRKLDEGGALRLPACSDQAAQRVTIG